MDKRISKTRKKLLNGLIVLFETKNPSEVNISELCKTAGVNRNTFYSHFNTIDDLYSDILKEYVEVVSSIIEPNLLNGNYRKALYDMCLFSINNTDMQNFIYVEEFRQRLYSSTINKYKARFIKHLEEDMHIPLYDSEMICDYIIGGLTSILNQWHKNDMQDSVEDIVERIMVPTNLIINNYLK